MMVTKNFEYEMSTNPFRNKLVTPEYKSILIGINKVLENVIITLVFGTKCKLLYAIV